MTIDTKTVITAQDLTKSFGSGSGQVKAVDGISLAVPAGEMLLIMGPSGSGKTTLLTILGGLLHPDSGSVQIEDVDITSLPDRKLTELRRRKVGFIFQSFNLWESLTVSENVELSLNIAGVPGRRATDKAHAVLTELGLGARLNFAIGGLSGGEKQRVSIARAVVNNPPLVLADEPTANLDSAHGYEVMMLLRNVARSGDRAVVVVSHDQRIREVADRVMWLEDGRIKDIGGLFRDPVCEMSVEAARAVSLEWNGETYHFCANGCRREFEADPERFINRPRAGAAPVRPATEGDKE